MLLFLQAFCDQLAALVRRIGGRPARLVPAIFLAGALLCVAAHGQNGHEGKRVSDVLVTFEGDDRNLSISEQFRQLARDAVGPVYSAVKLRDALEQLYATRRISSVSVETVNVTPESV